MIGESPEGRTVASWIIQKFTENGEMYVTISSILRNPKNTFSACKKNVHFTSKFFFFFFLTKILPLTSTVIS